MERPHRDSDNPHFRSRYASLEAVSGACMTALRQYGFAVYWTLTDTHCVTVLAHESGETLTCPVPLRVDKGNMQALGSAITYARRYGLLCLAGLAPDDDDGNAAAAAPAKVESVQEASVRERKARINGTRLAARMEWQEFTEWAAKVLDANLVAPADLAGLSDSDVDALQQAVRDMEATA